MRVACPVDLTDYIKENAEEAEFISFYDIEEDEILSNERIKTSSSSLSSLLEGKEVDVFICSNRRGRTNIYDSKWYAAH